MPSDCLLLRMNMCMFVMCGAWLATWWACMMKPYESSTEHRGKGVIHWNICCKYSFLHFLCPFQFVQMWQRWLCDYQYLAVASVSACVVHDSLAMASVSACVVHGRVTVASIFSGINNEGEWSTAALALGKKQKQGDKLLATLVT